MEFSTFEKQIREFCDITTVIKKVNNGKITRSLIERITSISVKEISEKLLATIFEERYETEYAEYLGEFDYMTHQIPHIYIVWSDDYIEKYNRIRTRFLHYLYGNTEPFKDICSDDIDYHGNDAKESPAPIASCFIKRDDVKNIVLIWELGEKNGDDDEKEFRIIIYEPSVVFSLSSISKKIMMIFEKEGIQGLKNHLLKIKIIDF